MIAPITVVDTLIRTAAAEAFASAFGGFRNETHQSQFLSVTCAQSRRYDRYCW